MGEIRQGLRGQHGGSHDELLGLHARNWHDHVTDGGISECGGGWPGSGDAALAGQKPGEGGEEVGRYEGADGCVLAPGGCLEAEEGQKGILEVTDRPCIDG